jgi:hypothetical protein
MLDVSYNAREEDTPTQLDAILYRKDYYYKCKKVYSVAFDKVNKDKTSKIIHGNTNMSEITGGIQDTAKCMDAARVNDSSRSPWAGDKAMVLSQ